MSELVTAARNNDVEGLERLLKVEDVKQIDPESGGWKYSRGQVACMEAAKHNHPEAVNLLMDTGSSGVRGEELAFEHISKFFQRLCQLTPSSFFQRSSARQSRRIPLMC